MQDGSFGGWLFQCSPRKFRIFNAVNAGDRISNWAAKQHRDEIQVGDRAALWVSEGEPGYSAGVYAIGSVASRSWTGVVDRRYWVGPPPEPSEFVDIDFNLNVFHFPVEKSILSNDTDFQGAGILTMPRFTTSMLSASEWSAIERRVLKHAPTINPTLALGDAGAPKASASTRDRRRRGRPNENSYLAERARPGGFP